MAKHGGEIESRDEADMVEALKSVRLVARPVMGKHGVVEPVPSNVHPLFRRLVAPFAAGGDAA